MVLIKISLANWVGDGWLYQKKPYIECKGNLPGDNGCSWQGVSTETLRVREKDLDTNGACEPGGRDEETGKTITELEDGAGGKVLGERG